MLENYFRLIIMQLYISESRVFQDESEYVTVGYGSRVYYSDFKYIEDLIRRIDSILNGDDK